MRASINSFEHPLLILKRSFPYFDSEDPINLDPLPTMYIIALYTPNFYDSINVSWVKQRGYYFSLPHLVDVFFVENNVCYVCLLCLIMCMMYYFLLKIIC